MTSPRQPARERERTEWRRAGRALLQLVRNPERTALVFEIIEAAAGPSGDRCYEAFLSEEEGVALLARRPDLLATLSDRNRLRRLPAGSLGRTYAEFMDAADLSPAGLVEASEAMGGSQAPNPIAPDPDREWFLCRLRDAHDLWHVLTGYGRDEAGEVALLAFSYAQIRNRGIGLIALAGALVGSLRGGGLAWPAYLWQAYRRGYQASGLQRAPFEDWMARPLAEVRRELGIDPPEVAHPGGVVAADRSGEVRLGMGRATLRA